MTLTLEIIRQRKDKIDRLMKLVYASEINEILFRGLDDGHYEVNFQKQEEEYQRLLTELQNTK